MKSILIQLLEASAWPMNTPRPYSAFHLCLTAAGGLTAFLLARHLSRAHAGQAAVLPVCGIILAVSEIYKQLFLYYIVNGGSFDWWYFPFQLCSVPMYLCLLLPLTKKAGLTRTSQAFLTFIQDYGFLGGVMALAEPSGLMHPYWTLTLHGLLWHLLLLFMGFFCAQSGLGGRSRARFLYALPLFLFCCAAATAVNILSHPYGNADMFYISPYYPNGQAVFHQIALAVGTLPGNLLYLLSIILGAAIIHLLLGRVSSRGSQASSRPQQPARPESRQ